MTTRTKTLWVLAFAGVCLAGLMVKRASGPSPGHTRPAEIEGTWPSATPATSSTPAPTPPAFVEAVSTPYAVPMPYLWPSPPPVPTEEQVREMVRKEMDEAYRRGQEEERRRAEQQSIPPVPANPWESEEDRALKARKYGFQLLDKAGAEWGRIHRVDGDDIVKGLFPETTAVESKARPIVTEKDGAWTVTFEPLPEAKP